MDDPVAIEPPGWMRPGKPPYEIPADSEPAPSYEPAPNAPEPDYVDSPAQTQPAMPFYEVPHVLPPAPFREAAARVPEPDYPAQHDSYEHRAYEILRELAGDRLPTVQVPEPLRDMPLKHLLFMQLRMYMHDHGIEDNELIRILNAQSTAFDRTSSRFTVSADLHYAN